MLTFYSSTFRRNCGTVGETDQWTNKASREAASCQLRSEYHGLYGRGYDIIDSRKSVRWSAVPVPCLRWKLREEQGSGPEGVDDLCFHTYGGFSPSSPPPPPPSLPPSNPSLEAQIPVSRPKSQSRGPNPSLKAQILASRPKS